MTVSWSVNTLDETFRADMDRAVSIERRLEAMQRVYEAGIRTVCFVSPIFPGITDPKAIMERVRGFADLVWLENLNLRGQFKATILAYIREKHPELVPLYEEIYNRRRTEYWQALEQEIAAYAAANGFPYRVNDPSGHGPHRRGAQAKRTRKGRTLQGLRPSREREKLSAFAVLAFEKRRIARSPRNHRVDDRQQRSPQLRQRILRTGRQFGIDGLGDQAVLDQLPELKVQHPRCGFGQLPVQFARAQRPVAQLVQNTGLPFRVHQAHGQPQRAIQIDGYLSFVHGCMVSACKDRDNLRIRGYTE